MWEMIWQYVRDIFGNQHIQLDHIHSKQHTFPTQADSLVLTSGTADWAWGTLTEIIPANTITAPFDIHWVGIGRVSATDAVYEVELFAGAEGFEVEIGQFRVYRQATQSGAAPTPMQTPIQPANTRISARCAVEDGGDKTIGIALFYHTY